MLSSPKLNFGLIILLILAVSACERQVWNNPYPKAEEGKSILYSNFSSRPKHLDPAKSYSSDEYVFLGNIYEPPLHYHYLKRPYVLEPLTAVSMPKPLFYNNKDQNLGDKPAADQVAYTEYEIKIKPGIRYQPHPAFALNESGLPRYLNLKHDDLKKIDELSDFPHTGTRELVAADYVYQIKRLAHPRLHSPILSTMSKYIVGLEKLEKELTAHNEGLKNRIKSLEAEQLALSNTTERTRINTELAQAKIAYEYINLNSFDLSGVKLIDRYTYRIRVLKQYPQLLEWLAMPFFSPMPPEADRFYSQEGFAKKNITLDWYPIGTGAYMLAKNDPNSKMVMERNPNFRGIAYPSEGSAQDRERGLLNDAGKLMPFVDKIVYSLDKESIPIWHKFQQGYYDVSGINEESFDKAVQVGSAGNIELTSEMAQKNIKLATNTSMTTVYFGFNMKDPLVGGYSPAQQKLRQAISIAIDMEEYISIFMNGRGEAAQSPLPPGIFGYSTGSAGINPQVYRWVDGRVERRPIEDAKKLLREAGYENGRDKEGHQLLLYLDVGGAGAEDKARYAWYKKQFNKIGVQLEVRPTDSNYFQQKVKQGSVQIFTYGWNADYPDPENFLFLLYGPNGRKDFHGENAANYDNPEFNRLFKIMETMDNGPEREKVIQEMLKVARIDAPWIWGYHPKSYVLFHEWYRNANAHAVAHNTMMYKRIDAGVRVEQRVRWNSPVVWPVILVFILLLLSLVPAIRVYHRKIHQLKARA